MKNEIKTILKDFDSLNSAFIDSSSIIYLSRLDILDKLKQAISLYSIEEILKEVGYSNLNLIMHDHKHDDSLSNDIKLVKSAKILNLPVISEDKKLLLNAEKSGLKYYNSIVILIFLLYKNRISQFEFESYKAELLKFARYSEKVKNFSNAVLQEIIINKM
jgi:hypothetical protein